MLLLSAKLPKGFWGEAINTTAYLINRSPPAALDFKVPEEVLSGQAPDYKHLRVFGCVTYAHVRQGKLEPRAKKCIFVGYLDGVKGYKLWYKEGGVSKIVISKDVVFREDHMFMDAGGELAQGSSDNQTCSEQVELEFQNALAHQQSEPEADQEEQE